MQTKGGRDYLQTLAGLVRWGEARRLLGLQATADYRWLRGTHDDGRHTVVNRLIVNRAGRGMRKTMRVGLAAIELISQVCRLLGRELGLWV